MQRKTRCKPPSKSGEQAAKTAPRAIKVEAQGLRIRTARDPPQRIHRLVTDTGTPAGKRRGNLILPRLPPGMDAKMADGNGTNGNGFTTKEILVRLEDKVDRVIADHENRLRSLERFRYAVPSVAIIAALATIALAILTAVQH